MEVQETFPQLPMEEDTFIYSLNHRISLQLPTRPVRKLPPQPREVQEAYLKNKRNYHDTLSY